MWAIPPSCAGVADITHDNIVNGQDLGFLLAAWNTAWSAADLDDNGIVGGGDLGLLLEQWQSTTP